jgi:hypothetical protein
LQKAKTFVWLSRTRTTTKVSHGTLMIEVLMNLDPIGFVLMFAGLLFFLLAIQWGRVAHP